MHYPIILYRWYLLLNPALFPPAQHKEIVKKFAESLLTKITKTRTLINELSRNFEQDEKCKGWLGLRSKKSSHHALILLHVTFGNSTHIQSCSKLLILRLLEVDRHPGGWCQDIGSWVWQDAGDYGIWWSWRLWHKVFWLHDINFLIVQKCCSPVPFLATISLDTKIMGAFPMNKETYISPIIV